MRVPAGPLVHAIFELLAYVTGFALSRRAWARERRSFAARPGSGWIAVAAILGAAVGSKVLFLLQFPDFAFARFPSAEALLSGKTIVGGLLGGLLGVEIAKKRLGVSDSTGDLFTFPVIAGLAVGRLGCLATSCKSPAASRRSTRTSSRSSTRRAAGRSAT